MSKRLSWARVAAAAATRPVHAHQDTGLAAGAVGYSRDHFRHCAARQYRVDRITVQPWRGVEWKSA